MTQQEYEQKKRECWEEFNNDVAMCEDHPKVYFSRAFDRAYALGKEKEIITQDEIEKAAEEYVLTRQQARHNAKREEDATMRDFDKTIKDWDAYDMEQAFESGANLFLGKQEKDAEQTKAEGKVTISLHVAVIPGQEEFYMGVDASHEAYTIDIPNSMIPSDLLAVINGECNNKVVTNIAIMK